MSPSAMIPLRVHAACTALRGLLPIQHAVVWDPEQVPATVDCVLNHLATSVRYLAVPTLSEDIGSLLSHGFLDTGTCLDDGRELFVYRCGSA